MRSVVGIIKFAFIAFWSIFSICLSLLLKAITGKKQLPLNMARTFWSPFIVWIVGARVKVEGSENLDATGPYIFVSNHQSFLDIPVLFKHIPINLHFMGKEELKKMPFIGWFMKSMGMIFVNRKNRAESMKSLEQAGKLIDSGKSLMIFPEGTRSKTGKLGMFKKGSFFIAKASKAPVVPIYIHNARLVWPSTSIKFKSGDVQMIIGEPVEHEKLEKLSVKDMADLLKEKVQELAAKV